MQTATALVERYGRLCDIAAGSSLGDLEFMRLLVVGTLTRQDPRDGSILLFPGGPSREVLAGAAGGCADGVEVIRG